MRNRSHRRRPQPLTTLILTASLCAAGLATAASVQAQEAELLAYFPFDGGSVEEAARGIPSDVIVSGESGFDGFGIVAENDGGPRGSGTGQVDPDGRYGEAITLSESSGPVLVPLDLDFSSHPRITVSMWVKIASEEAGERGHLLSTGRGADRTPGLSLQNGHVVADAVGGRLHNYAADLRVGEWNHVAAIWDATENRVRIYTGGRGDERTSISGFDGNTIASAGRSQSELENPLHPEWLPTRHLVLGDLLMDGSRVPHGVSLDEVRIWSGALTEEELAEIMRAETPPPLGPVAPPPPPPAERETFQVAEDDRWEDTEPGGEEPEGDRGELTGWELSGDYELSGVSGSTGDATTRAEFSGPGTENAYVRAAEVWEKSNRPCMVVLGAQVRGESAPTVDDYSDCDVTDSSRQLDVHPGSGDRDAVTALQVCQNRRNERVKGLRLRTDRWELGDDDIVFREQSEEEDEAPNCNGNWQGTVSCPAGSVGTGVVAHWDRETRGIAPRFTSSELVGLELVCREMVAVYR